MHVFMLFHWGVCVLFFPFPYHYHHHWKYGSSNICNIANEYANKLWNGIFAQNRILIGFFVASVKENTRSHIFTLIRLLLFRKRNSFSESTNSYLLALKSIFSGLFFSLSLTEVSITIATFSIPFLLWIRFHAWLTLTFAVFLFYDRRTERKKTYKTFFFEFDKRLKSNEIDHFVNKPCSLYFIYFSFVFIFKTCLAINSFERRTKNKKKKEINCKNQTFWSNQMIMKKIHTYIVKVKI